MFDTTEKAFGYTLLFLSVFIATITYKKYKETPSQYFLWFLWLTVLVECFGLFQYYYYKDCTFGIMPFVMNLVYKGYLPEIYLTENAWLYNSHRIFIFPFYIYYYYLLIKNLKKKRLLKFLLILCIIVSLIDLVINREVFISTKLLFTRISGGIFILISSAIYLMEVLKSNELLTFHKTLPFWITIGALVFYLTTIPILIFKEYLYSVNYLLYSVILFGSGCFLYGTFIAGFIINAIGYNKKEKFKINEK